MEVTVTGGTGNPAIALQYHNGSPALAQASMLAASISQNFSSATYYSQSGTPVGGDYLIATKSAIGAATINASGYKAVVIQNTGVTATVVGGGSPRQDVLASNGGLTFSLGVKHGDTTVVAGGGANSISFAGGTGKDAVFTSDGNDTIVGGNGQTTIKAGGGSNDVTIGGGSTYEVVSGQDSIQLGSGAETIKVLGPGSATINGASSVTVPAGHFSLSFIGNGMASTVLSGAGSYSIKGGTGGGLFEAGTAGGNVIRGGTGNLTIFGAASGFDLLQAGSGASLIVASASNDTLIGANHGGSATLTGGGATGVNDVFTFKPNGFAATDEVTNFAHGMDFLNVSAYGPHEAAYVMNHLTVAGGNTTFTLQDGTKVTLDGVTNLTNSDFK
jgi:Ca2+-binding RTX toxin-like protein